MIIQLYLIFMKLQYDITNALNKFEQQQLQQKNTAHQTKRLTINITYVEFHEII